LVTILALLAVAVAVGAVIQGSIGFGYALVAVPAMALPAPQFGAMLAESVRYFTVVPTQLFIPGTALFILVLSFNLFGDAVRDALDPRAGRM